MTRKFVKSFILNQTALDDLRAELISQQDELVTRDGQSIKGLIDFDDYNVLKAMFEGVDFEEAISKGEELSIKTGFQDRKGHIHRFNLDVTRHDTLYTGEIGLLNGKKLKIIREKIGWSIEYLSHCCHISPTTLRRFETGKKDIPFQTQLFLLMVFQKIRHNYYENPHLEDEMQQVLDELLG